MTTLHDRSSRRVAPEDFRAALDTATARLAAAIARLDPGPAAQLRRGPLAETGAPAFWRLLTRLELERLVSHLEGWAAVMQGIAIMTPKGGNAAKPAAHDASVPVGRALAEADISELRLARLLSAPRATRQDLALRACRVLARTNARIDWRQMVRLILFGDRATARRIAADYYDTLDSAARESGANED